MNLIISKDLWRDNLILPDDYENTKTMSNFGNLFRGFEVVKVKHTKENFGEVVAYSLKQEKLADEEGNIVIHNKNELTYFINNYLNFFRDELFNDILIKIYDLSRIEAI